MSLEPPGTAGSAPKIPMDGVELWDHPKIPSHQEFLNPTWKRAERGSVGILGRVFPCSHHRFGIELPAAAAPGRGIPQHPIPGGGTRRRIRGKTFHPLPENLQRAPIMAEFSGIIGNSGMSSAFPKKKKKAGMGWVGCECHFSVGKGGALGRVWGFFPPSQKYGISG